MTPSTIKTEHQAATDKRAFWPGHWHMAALIERKKRQEANPAKGKKV